MTETPSGLWELPPPWKWRLLGEPDVATMRAGGTPLRSVQVYYGGPIPWAKIGDLTKVDGGVLTTTEESLTEDGLANSSAYVAEEGTVLVSMYGSIGTVALAGVPVAFNQAIIGIRCNEKVLDPRFLLRWIVHSRAFLAKQGRGGTQSNLNAGHVKKWPVPIPPPADQGSAVQVLDQIDGLQHALRNEAQRLRALEQAVAARVFTGTMGSPSQ